MQDIKRLPVFPMPRYGPLSTHPKSHRAAPIARELRSQFRRECRILTYPKHGFPVVIAEWPRNNRELIRVSLGHLNTCFTIDIRCWWRDPKIGRAHSELQSPMYLVCRLLLEKKNSY